MEKQSGNRVMDFRKVRPRAAGPSRHHEQEYNVCPWL